MRNHQTGYTLKEEPKRIARGLNMVLCQKFQDDSNISDLTKWRNQRAIC